MKKPRIFIGVPSYGSIHPLFSIGLMKLFALCGRQGVHTTLRWVRHDSLISRARNTLTSQFLASDCDYMLQLDDDIEWQAETMLAMVMRGEPIIGGLYYLKRPGMIACANNIPGQLERQDGTQIVRSVGTGMLSVHREVFEHMISSGKAEPYTLDDDQESGPNIWDFWQVGVKFDNIAGRKRYLSEDWYFCQVARELGYDVILDKCNLGIHHGAAAYPLELTCGMVVREQAETLP